MPHISTIVGCIAAALVLLTFTTRQMRTLRLIAISSNLAFIAYGVLNGLPPIVVLHVTLLPVNLLRLVQLAKKPAPAAAIVPLQGPLRVERLRKIARGQWQLSLSGSDDRSVTLSLVHDRSGPAPDAATAGAASRRLQAAMPGR